MKEFSPSTVWAWFKKRHVIWKWILFIFVCVIVVIAFVWWSMTKPFSSGGDIVKIAIEELENASDEELERTREENKKLKEDIEKELEKRKKNKEERKKKNEEAKDIHEKIDDADSIDELANISTNSNDSRR